ncbi:MAG: hypothetical protein JW822_09405 [Spirochaetales bacterium]|nr:hypothetical protein [Spirochaetales bacterium]
MRKILLFITMLVLVASAVPAQEAEAPVFTLELRAEMGFTGILRHVIQSGPGGDIGDEFDYLARGNQDTLFPFTRFEAEAGLFQNHKIILLYQPLTLETEAPITSAFRFNGVDYDPADGFLFLTYAFDFWRVSYLYEILSPPDFFLGVGISLQIRNASIVFRSQENGKGTVQDNIGPVPIIKLRVGYEWENGFYLLFEGDGFYASSAIFNGAEYDFMGYIYDVSLRGGYKFDATTGAYLNVRFLGGGADGTNSDDQFTYNDLHTVSASVGLQLKF